MTETRIGIVVGSIREKAQSARMAAEIETLLTTDRQDTSVDMFSLRDIDLPLWSEEKRKADSDLKAQWNPISERLKACDGFVVITPEWAGMVPPHLKNFLLMCDGGELAHKPGQLVSVSSGAGGAYPIAELRMSGYKNNFIWWMPDHVILRKVEELFTASPPTETDRRSRGRLQYALAFLVETAKAVGPIRERLQDLKTYKNGM